MKKQKHRHREKTVRLTIESLGKNAELEEIKRADLSENKFKKILKSVVDENDQILRKLADR